VDECGKSLAVVTVRRDVLEWSRITGVRLDETFGHELGDGGDSVWCSNVRCGAGPRYFPEGIAGLIRDAIEKGDRSLYFDLPGGRRTPTPN
jgi:hypothetical protein